MTPQTTETAIAELRRFLGDERFRRFVLATRERVDEPQLHFWQDAALDELAAAASIDLPRSPAALAALLTDAVLAPAELAEEDLPTWLVVEHLGGSCPVQGWGTCGAWSWYFRARGEHWSIGVCDGSFDPVDVRSTSDVTFYHEELYEYRVTQYDAGYMPLEEARYLIVRELSRLRSRGLPPT